MNFSEAVRAAKSGRLVQRAGWDGPEIRLSVEMVEMGGVPTTCVCLRTPLDRLSPGNPYRMDFFRNQLGMLLTNCKWTSGSR